MSVIVRGMKLPHACDACPMFSVPILMCRYTARNINSDNFFCKRDEKCPLIELPEKHGRLIDEDALSSCGYAYGSIKPLIDIAPTIMESEG